MLQQERPPCSHHLLGWSFIFYSGNTHGTWNRLIIGKGNTSMLKNTFNHMRGIGTMSERRLWDSGILSWDDLLNGGTRLLSRRKRDTLTAAIEESIQHLEARNPRYFDQRLPSNQSWRVFKDFRDRIAYLDIETTGLEGEITTIALYDGKSIKTYVRGRNLDQFERDIHEYDVIVTYNGKCFDVPFIESDLGIELNQVHIDLRYLLKSVGFSGGLLKDVSERQVLTEEG